MSWAETVIALNRSLGKSTFAPLDEQIQEASMPAGFGNFNRTIFEYSTEISLARNPYTFAKFIAPETGTYKYTFDIVRMPGNTDKEYRLGIYSTSFLGTKQTFIPTSITVYRYVPELSFNQYIESVIGEIRPTFNTDASTQGNTLITEFKVSLLDTYANNTLYIPANKGQAIVIADVLSVYPRKIKNQKITY